MRPSESGRSYISKGFLKQAKKCANKNVLLYHPLISEKTPLLGIEPSAIYTFLDEYPKLSSFPKESIVTRIRKFPYSVGSNASASITIDLALLLIWIVIFVGVVLPLMNECLFPLTILNCYALFKTLSYR